MEKKYMNITNELRRIAHELTAKKYKILCTPKQGGYATFSIELEAGSYSEALRAAEAMFDRRKYGLSIIGGALK